MEKTLIKHGLILYLKERHGGERTQGGIDQFLDSVHSTDVTAVCLATTQGQVVQCWWSLIREGMHRISYVSAQYDPTADRLHSFTGPSQLMGC